MCCKPEPYELPGRPPHVGPAAPAAHFAPRPGVLDQPVRPCRLEFLLCFQSSGSSNEMRCRGWRIKGTWIRYSLLHHLQRRCILPGTTPRAHRRFKTQRPHRCTHPPSSPNRQPRFALRSLRFYLSSRPLLLHMRQPDVWQSISGTCQKRGHTTDVPARLSRNQRRL